MGIRLDPNFMEEMCKLREHCPYYTNVSLGVALSHPDDYQELETYNSNECIYFDKQWNSKTSETEKDGQQTPWSSVWLK